ncbi:MAG TPA: hypothetical protein VFF10_06330 [Trueperaceae bacterium]|nr:hypothetical protein [Trueperaceae bacterium]
MRKLTLVLLVGLLGSVALAQAPTYFVKADMVRGAQGAMGPACVPNSVFFNGEMIVFRAVVYDAATGEELTFDQIQERGITATVNMDGAEPLAMFFPPPQGSEPEGEAEGEAEGEGEGGPPPGADFFRGPFAIPADFPSGVYTWTIEVTDSAGNSAEFSPIGASAGLPSLIVQPAN